MLSGPGGLTKVDSGTLILAATSTYSGNTFVSGGTIVLSGSLDSASSLSLAGGAFNFAPSTNGGTGNTQAVNGLTLNSGASAISVTAGNTLALGRIVRTSGSGVSFSGGRITTSQANSNGILGPWAVYGSGTTMEYAIVSGSAPYTIVPFNAATAITSGLAGLADTTGTVNYTLSGGGGTLAAAVTANTLQFTGTANAVTASPVCPLSLNGIMNVGAGNVIITGGALVIGANRELVFTGPGNVTVASVIQDDSAGPSALTMLGNGVLTLAATNTFSGNTVIGAGTLALGESLALQSSTLDTSGGGNLSFGSLAVATLGGLTGPGALNLANTTSSPVALSVGNNSTSTTYSGTLSGSGSLAKVGTGTLVLDGVSTYTGPTTVNQGELAVNGSLASPVTVNSGGTLGGSGFLSSVTISPSGAIAPGNPLGTMTITGSLGLVQSATMDYELDTPGTSDMISCGNSALNGQQFSDFNFTPTANFGPGVYNLIDASSVSGTGLGANCSGTIDGYVASLAVQGDDLVLTVVPEPSTLGLLGIAAIGLAGYGWRCRRVTRTAKPAAFAPQDAPAILSFPAHSPQALQARRAA